MNQKWIYSFEEGNGDQKHLLGGKGAGLAQMKRIGLPVPDGFTITTEACKAYQKDKSFIAGGLSENLHQALKALETKTGKGFGNPDNPLLVSVRSGAVFSMPGMMDTILNLGLNAETTQGLAKKTGNERFALDCYRRFIQMFADVVMGIEKYRFDHLLESFKADRGLSLDTELDSQALKSLIEAYEALIFKHSGTKFPADPMTQLHMAIESVFKSWENPRAVIYRNLHQIAHDLGTAVNVQEMVFGNMGETSGTGVAFTRNPSTGDSAFMGEFLMNAQGEDVVAGIRTPEPIVALRDKSPAVYEQFLNIAKQLERHYKDMQDIEFTVECGKLFILQTRNGKRTAQAALAIAVDLANEGVITREEAVLRIAPEQLDQLLHPKFSEKALGSAKQLAKGLPASPGAASGHIFFTAEDVAKAKAKGQKAILVRNETSPEDIEGMIAGEGILTARGGMTSHAAVVARGMGKCCVAGCSEAIVEPWHKKLIFGDTVLGEGDVISLNGSDGCIYLGEIEASSFELSDAFQTLMQWADGFRKLEIRTNADTARDAKQAMAFGAEGIGLCRTEHMFFEESRIPYVRQMILAQDPEVRAEALNKLGEFQQADFEAIFSEVKGQPVTIRLLDPPLHEFLPAEAKDIEALAQAMRMPVDALLQVIKGMHEVNPMLGHRGCRLAITWPEIYEMQVKAILKAALVIQAKGVAVQPEIMVPLVGFRAELKQLKAQMRAAANVIFAEAGTQISYKIGTMIEVPRAALTADEIAEDAEFFSFGTNDLTQMTLGFSRDDSGKFIGAYKSSLIFDQDPFETIDQLGVGKLMKMAVLLGKATRPQLKTGICGEHGGEPKSIAFCHELGLNYVSCSPFRVPVARLAAAQAALK